ncbi:tetratricopeptide repeat protein [Planctomicrobium sp. SH527]|uniref:tetratricopeptide repeat protein n=1 Tax=Planctomicrobium sp. SH527 TaxID=3448123 RepID=UPI003F5B6E5F
MFSIQWRRAQNSVKHSRARVDLLVVLTLVQFFLLQAGELFAQAAPAASIDECRRLFQSGKYESCITELSPLLESKESSEDAFLLKAQAEFTLGKYTEARDTLLSGNLRTPGSIRIRWALMQYSPYAGQEKDVERYAGEIDRFVRAAAWQYSQRAEDLITLAKLLLRQGGDPKQVQNVLLKRAKELHPNRREPLLAMGQLALEKRDFTLAADTFREGLKKFPDDSDFLFGMACAYEESDSKQMQEALDKVLVINPRHVDALSMLVNQLIDRERYELAKETLVKIQAINPKYPAAFASLAVLAFLDGDHASFESNRTQALASWGTNPEVDHLIGKKLSRKYRFEDGAEAQRRALVLQPSYLPAMKQLAQDLLRLGQEEEGWQLAHAAHRQDEYDAASYNLVTLHDELTRFTVLELPGWRIRMEKGEAELYGDQVVALLTEARSILCQKYDLPLEKTISVEIYPKPNDFAVRTFGMPGAEGFLGVCFGDVVTALSPASQQVRPVNWQSVLWHEFAHVVTLNKTHNRMPRWLSEGISVYEERQRDPRWGERMTPAYREAILGGKLTPIHRMSEAFLSPGSGGGLMFAYFQSSLVVEYLINTYGHAEFVAILDDLALGMPINDAIERHTTSMGELEENFEAFAKLQARMFGWNVDWSKPEPAQYLGDRSPADQLHDWLKLHPRNYTGVKTAAKNQMQAGNSAEAIKLLRQAITVFPLEKGAEGASAILAKLQREAGDGDGEYETLLHWASIDDDAAAALLRLIEIDSARQNWAAVMQHSRRLLEIKPLIPQPYQSLATSAENLNQSESAVQALNALLTLPRTDGAGIHYRLASQFHQQGRNEKARFHVIRALEFAPRYRGALALLLKIKDAEATAEQKKEPASAN